MSDTERFIEYVEEIRENYELVSLRLAKIS